jgi:hypothetical protein
MVCETLVYSLINHLMWLVAQKGFTAFNHSKILGLKTFKLFLFKQAFFIFRLRVTYAATVDFAVVKLPHSGPWEQNRNIAKSSQYFIHDDMQ